MHESSIKNLDVRKFNRSDFLGGLMKYRILLKNSALSRWYPRLSRSQDDGKGFSYFQNETAVIKLSALAVLSAERIIIASLHMVSRLAVLGITLSAGSTFPEKMGKVLSNLLST